MGRIIAACGNDCSRCPRHLPKSDEELMATAKLWYEIGYRDHIVSVEEIGCKGCSKDNWCRYNIVKCCFERNIANCGECPENPCSNFKSCLEVTSSFEPKCREVCTPEEYDMMSKAFFEKKENLEGDR